MSETAGPIDWESYLDAVSTLIVLNIPAEHRQGTIAQLKLNAAIASPLLAFEMLGESRREEFEKTVGEYVDFYLSHMALEEREILPLAPVFKP